LTIDVLGQSILGHNFQALDSTTRSPTLEYYRTLVNAITRPFYFMFHRLDRWWNPFRYHAWHALYSLGEVFDQVIEARRATLAAESVSGDSGTPHPDVLSCLLAATDDTQDPEQRLTNKELKDNLTIMFIAGHDTTATALTAICYLLAVHQEYQDRLRAEINTVLPDANDVPKQSDKLPLLDAIIRESLRLYPPVKQFPIRHTDVDIDVEFGQLKTESDTTSPPTTTVRIPKGVNVIFDVYGLHHNPAVFPHPDEFRPERFLKGVDGAPVETGESGRFFAFNSGPRICLGMTFSLTEQRVVLATLVRRYKWTLPSDSIHRDHLVFFGSTLIAPKEVELIFEELAV